MKFPFLMFLFQIINGFQTIVQICVSEFDASNELYLIYEKTSSSE